jgi:hypothetical protein
MAKQAMDAEEAIRQATERAEAAEAELARLKGERTVEPEEEALETAGIKEATAPEGGQGEEELRRDPMMAHLLDALASGRDIGHYGRLVFAMVARHFMPHDEVLGWLMRDSDFSEEDAANMLHQVEQRDYNPPKRERLLEWQQLQEFPILPDPSDPDCGNLYRNLKFPDSIYHHITEYQEQKSA